jgi:vacuolar-type H+-ATPase subunit E/Vma4
MDQLLFYLLIAAILGLVAVVVMLLTAYLKLHSKALSLSNQNVYLKNQDDAKTEEILNQAHNRAVIILDEANKKAASLLTQSETVHNNAANTLEQKLDQAADLNAQEMKKASEQLLALYKDALAKIQSEEIKSANNITKSIDSIAEKQLAQFTNVLANQTINSEKMVEEKINKEYQAIEEELKAYKEKRFRDVDDNILQIIQSVTEVVLQKQLSVEDQEQLVYDALTRMKERSEMN